MAKRRAAEKATKGKTPSVIKLMEQYLLANVNKVVHRDDIKGYLSRERGGDVPENWHQRLSELRVDHGYDIESWRDVQTLKPGQYRLKSATRNPRAGGRVRPSKEAWERALHRAGGQCEWTDGGVRCVLKSGDIDPVSGGTVRLTPDHMTPHSLDPNTDPNNPDVWQAYCGRHQVIKKNYWDSLTGKLNVDAIVQNAPEQEKYRVYQYLKRYFEGE